METTTNKTPETDPGADTKDGSSNRDNGFNDSSAASKNGSNDSKVDASDPFVKFKDIPALQVTEYSKITRILKDHLYQTASYFRNLGHHDGVLGINRPEDINQMAQTYAKAFHEEARAELGGINGALQTEQEFYRETLSRAEEEYAEEKKHLNFINTHYRYNPSTYSKTLLLLYAVVGFFIFIADIPLALELISKGFHYLNSPKHPLADLFFHPRATFLFNWETFFISFGIAFVTIYIKIYYDEYVANTEAMDIMRREKLREMFNDQEAFNRELKVKFIVKTLILVLLIVLLAVLSDFRYQSSKILNPASVATPGARLVFFMITLMLPVIAGICFSLSLKIFQNNRSKGKAEKTFAAARTKLDECLKQHGEVEKKQKAVLVILNEWIGKADFIADSMKFYIAYYSNGYHHGILEPDKYDGITDFYTRVNMLRSKSAARKVFDIVRKKGLPV